MAIDVEDVLNLQNGVFWLILNVVLGAVALWTILIVVVFTRIDSKLQRFCIFRNLGHLADFLLPILGELGFIPIISVLLMVLICD